jgi:hypothetical protein
MSNFQEIKVRKELIICEASIYLTNFLATNPLQRKPARSISAHTRTAISTSSSTTKGRRCHPNTHISLSIPGKAARPSQFSRTAARTLRPRTRCLAYIRNSRWLPARSMVYAFYKNCWRYSADFDVSRWVGSWRGVWRRARSLRTILVMRQGGRHDRNERRGGKLLTYTRN